MADHIETEIFAFDSQFPSSSPASGSKLENVCGDCQEFQDTVPFDDAMVLDGPAQSEKLNSDTQKVDDHFEDEREVVLDSEDEGYHGTRLVNAANGLSDRGRGKDIAGTFRKRKLNLSSEKQGNGVVDAYASTDQEGRTGKKGWSIDSECADGGRDCQVVTYGPETARLNYICSQEPGESSQANALGFVDHFVMVNAVNLSPAMEPRKSIRKKSPPVSSAKRLQKLAKRIKPGTPLRGRGHFEWVHIDQGGGDFPQRVKGIFESRGSEPEPGVSPLKARCLENKEGSNLVDECEKKIEYFKGLSNFSSSVENAPTETCRIEQVSETNLVNNWIKQFDDQLQAEASDEQMDAIPFMFDVGINTQIAAEAMEALLYAPPAVCSNENANQGIGTSPEDSPRVVSKRKYDLELNSFHKVSGSCLEGIARWSKRGKRSARKYSKEICTSSEKNNNYQLDLKLAVTAKEKGSKLLTDGLEDRRHPANENENSGRKSIKLQSEGESVVHQTVQWIKGGKLKGIKDQSDNSGERNDVMETGVLTQRRKRRVVPAAPSEVLRAGTKCSKFSFSATGKAGKNHLSRQEQVGPEVATITTFLNFDPLNCPRRKRSCRVVRMNPNAASNVQASFTAIIGEESNAQFFRIQKSKDNGELAVYNLNMKEKAQSVNANLLCHSLETESGELDDLDSSSFSGAVKNTEFGISLNKSSQFFGPKLTDTVNHKNFLTVASIHNRPDKSHKRTCKKNVPKSSLLKELISLDVPKAMADFTWKDSRKRRDMTNVRVLFSQHLDDGTIKQQKKILRRLGISIAACFMDATHFIADRFVRTRNMLEAIALGKPVVTHLWLENCGQANCLIDEKNYILRDEKKEKEIGFSMPTSLTRASQHPLLKGQRVFITPNIRPDKEMISSLVKAVHGQAVERSQISATENPKVPNDLFILSCEEDKKICSPFLDKGATIYSSELLLNGIVIQKLECERHQLFTNGVKRNGSNKRSRFW